MNKLKKLIYGVLILFSGGILGMISAVNYSGTNWVMQSLLITSKVFAAISYPLGFVMGITLIAWSLHLLWIEILSNVYRFIQNEK